MVTEAEAADALTYGVGLTSYAAGISSGGGLDRNFGLVRGKRAVLETVLRSWHSPKGSLITDPDRGVDIRDYLSADLTSASVQFEIRSALMHEALRDRRVQAQGTTIALSFDRVTGVLRIMSVIQLVAGGSITFGIDVSKAGTDLFRYLEAA